MYRQPQIPQILMHAMVALFSISHRTKAVCTEAICPSLVVETHKTENGRCLQYKRSPRFLIVEIFEADGSTGVVGYGLQTRHHPRDHTAFFASGRPLDVAVKNVSARHNQYGLPDVVRDERHSGAGSFGNDRHISWKTRSTMSSTAS